MNIRAQVYTQIYVKSVTIAIFADHTFRQYWTNWVIKHSYAWLAFCCKNRSTTIKEDSHVSA